MNEFAGKTSANTRASPATSQPSAGKRTLVDQANIGVPPTVQLASSSQGGATVPGQVSVTAPATMQAQSAAQANFLSDSARAELIRRVGHRIGSAGSNYNIAVTEVKLSRLMKKPEDLPWALGLLLDVVGAHFTLRLTSRSLRQRRLKTTCVQ